MIATHSRRSGAQCKDARRIGRASMVEQTLKSGLVINQDYSDAVRAVFFETGYEEFQYAGGGTAFLTRIADQFYAVTCRHVLRDFKADQIFLTQKRFAEKGSPPAPVAELIYPSKPEGFASESDVMDQCAIRMKADIPADFFHDPPYVVDEGTVASSDPGDRLEVFGVLSCKSAIEPPDLAFSFGRLEFHDYGNCRFDPVLHEARSKFDKPQFDSVDGISGAPVFNVTKGKLCGMVLRGGMNGADCTIYYLDIAHIRHLLLAAVERRNHTRYEGLATIMKV